MNFPTLTPPSKEPRAHQHVTAYYIFELYSIPMDYLFLNQFIKPWGLSMKFISQSGVYKKECAYINLLLPLALPVNISYHIISTCKGPSNHFAHPSLFGFTWIHLNLLMFTLVPIGSLGLTKVQFGWPEFVWFYLSSLCSLGFT